MKLRLLLFSKCNRNCAGCCNKDRNLDALPSVSPSECKDYEFIMLTGGEPMLEPQTVIETFREIRKLNSSQVIMYTAKTDEIDKFIEVLTVLDGVTLTLHEQSDVENFLALNQVIKNKNIEGKSLRLNVFSNVDIAGVDVENWVVRDSIEWIENCPLPKDEVIMRLRSHYND